VKKKEAKMAEGVAREERVAIVKLRIKGRIAELLTGEQESVENRM
jgi:hypothetical protein